MNRSLKKLVLNKETVRSLQDAELWKVAGGATEVTRVTCHGPCFARLPTPYDVQWPPAVSVSYICCAPEADVKD